MSNRNLPNPRYFVDSQHGGYPTYYSNGSYRRDPYEDRLLSDLGRESDAFGASGRNRSGISGSDRYGGSSSLLDPADRFTRSSYRTERDYGGGSLWEPSGSSGRDRPPSSRYSNTLGRDTFNPYSRIGYNEPLDRGIGGLIPRNPPLRSDPLSGFGTARLEGDPSSGFNPCSSARDRVGAGGGGYGRAGLDDYRPVDGRSRSHRQVDDIIRDPSRRTPGGCMGFGGYKSDFADDGYGVGGAGYGGGSGMYGGGYGGGGWGFY